MQLSAPVDLMLGRSPIGVEPEIPKVRRLIYFNPLGCPWLWTKAHFELLSVAVLERCFQGPCEVIAIFP